VAGTLQILSRTLLAFRRARLGILLIGCAYIAGVITGAIAVHAGHKPSLAFRDKIVLNAQRSSAILRYSDQGRPFAAASLDFAGNLVAATATAATGWWAPGPFPLAVYRGWIGGIVSVDDKHQSRFTGTQSGLYYVVVATLQLVGYILSGGAGVNLGLARTHSRPEYHGPRLFGVPLEAYKDAGYIYLVVIPTFAVASIIEFL
jgi:Stage II sporulation protein M